MPNSKRNISTSLSSGSRVFPPPPCVLPTSRPPSLTTGLYAYPGGLTLVSRGYAISPRQTTTTIQPSTSFPLLSLTSGAVPLPCLHPSERINACREFLMYHPDGQRGGPDRRWSSCILATPSAYRYSLFMAIWSGHAPHGASHGTIHRDVVRMSGPAIPPTSPSRSSIDSMEVDPRDARSGLCHFPLR